MTFAMMPRSLKSTDYPSVENSMLRASKNILIDDIQDAWGSYTGYRTEAKEQNAI